MVIIIKNILLFYYNFTNPELIIYDFKDNTFKYNDTTYIFMEFRENNIIFNNLDNRFHKIIINKYNKYVSDYNNKQYILLKINKNIVNKNIELNDLFEFYKEETKNIINKNNYYDLWKEKIEYLYTYYKDYFYNDDYDFQYYYGLSLISLNIIKNINNMNIKYGLSFNRFYNINTLYDLYNPLNIEYGPIINTFSEFLKNSFFKNKIIDYKRIFDLELNVEDYYYLIARLLFPTYYFDLFEDNKIITNYQLIIQNIDNYIKYVKEIILEIKKRHSSMPFLDFIINLL